jgi:citrate synthase
MPPAGHVAKWRTLLQAPGWQVNDNCINMVHMNDISHMDSLYMSADEASRSLGVSVDTLYAYVSRKMIRSEKVAGTRLRKYWKSDIDKLRRQAGVALTAKAQAVLVSESAITLIADGGLFFRGHDAIALSRHASVESVASLLWQADEALLFSTPPAAAPPQWEQLRARFASLSVPERAMAAFPLIEQANPRTFDLSVSGYARTAADVLRWYAALLVNSAEPCSEPLHLYVARKLKAPPGFDDLIRQLLVLTADHEFDPLTFAVRAVANVGVTPYQAVITGLIASQGQRFQAGRSATVMRFLEEIISSNDGQSVVVRRLRAGEALPGFKSAGGPRDPRPAAIMQSIDRLFHDDPAYRRLREAQDIALEASGLTIGFILPILFIGHRLGLHGSEVGLSVLGRMVGWLAHAMEQFHGHQLIRPHATYTGPLPAATQAGTPDSALGVKAGRRVKS